MAGYIFRIDKTQPEHWDLARKEGYWDFNLGHSIRPGEKCFFLLNDGEVLGRAVAVGERRFVPAGDHGPWGGERQYKYRVRLSDFEELEGRGVTEDDIRTALGRGLNPRSSSVLTDREIWEVDGLLEKRRR